MVGNVGPGNSGPLHTMPDQPDVTMARSATDPALQILQGFG